MRLVKLLRLEYTDSFSVLYRLLKIDASSRFCLASGLPFLSKMLSALIFIFPYSIGDHVAAPTVPKKRIIRGLDDLFCACKIFTIPVYFVPLIDAVTVFLFSSVT